MAVLTLAADGIEARVSAMGGRVLGLRWRGAQADRDGLPLLCEAQEGAGPDDRSAFPLIPFGNRLPGNSFLYGGRHHRLPPNTIEPLYLHGDGWLRNWIVEDETSRGLRLGFRHAGPIYRYEARQDIGIENGAFHLALTVTNCADTPMPFGLGWHPFLPRTPRMRLQLRARGFRTEKPGHLPGEAAPLPADLDFAEPALLPDRWVNNGLEDWEGSARIHWPERHLGLAIDADAVFSHAFLFLPDSALAPARDWFCFEPMTHRGGAHHHQDLGGLVALEPGASLRGGLRLTPFALPAEAEAS